MTNTCTRCGRPEPDAVICDRCASQTAQKLAEIAEVAPAARDVANGLSRRSHGGASGKPGSRLPLDLTAMAKLDSVQGVLTTWMRHVAEERGRAGWFSADGDPLVGAARSLGEHLEWMRHRPEADEFLTDVEACLRIVRSIARDPAPKRYLGPCGAPTHETCDNPYADGPCATCETCDGDVYAREGAQRGRCTTCGAEVAADERRAWLDDEVRGYAYTTSEIVAAYPAIRRNTINQWAARGRLTAHDHDGNGRARYNLGDVLDLAAGDAARREGDRATRARRTAARAADDERLMRIRQS